MMWRKENTLFAAFVKRTARRHPLTQDLHKRIIMNNKANFKFEILHTKKEYFITQSLKVLRKEVKNARWFHETIDIGSAGGRNHATCRTTIKGH